MIKRCIWLLAFSLISTLSIGQAEEKKEEEKGSLDAGSIESQYNYLIEESNNFQEYKVIKKNWVAKFRKSLSDTLEQQGISKKAAADLAKTQQKEIDRLNGELLSTQDSLQAAQKETSNMAWLGMDMNKASYRIIMWSIVGVLSLVMAVFFVMFRNSNAVTQDTKEKLNNLDEEFTEYKKRSLEREQKLRRELQDEINKQKT